MTTYDEGVELLILRRVVECDFNLQKAAKSLEIAKATIYSMFKRWNIKTPIDRHNSSMSRREMNQRCDAIEARVAELEEKTCSSLV